MSRSLLISNFLLFQIGWFACVLGGANQMPISGSLIACLIIATHLWRANNTGAELKLLTIAVFIGATFESLMVTMQLVDYSSGMVIPNMAPHWMILMWPLFATTINVSMRWLKNLTPVMIAALGAVIAPVAYFAGARLQAATFENMTLSLAIIALCWAILLPFLIMFARQYNGYASKMKPGASANV